MSWDYRVADLCRALLSNQAVEPTKANNYAKGLARMITGPGLK